MLWLQGSYGSDPSLTDCFDLFTQEETLEGDERPVSIILPTLVVYVYVVVVYVCVCDIPGIHVPVHLTGYTIPGPVYNYDTHMYDVPVTFDFRLIIKQR